MQAALEAVACEHAACVHSNILVYIRCFTNISRLLY